MAFALSIAALSAQMVEPYAAFSTFEPVMIWPSREWSAAPTKNLEYGCRLSPLQMQPGQEVSVGVL